jgi:gamma-glutamyltranspeptidase/glutathione hydrolase
MPIMGWDCITVPGAVSAWVALSKRFGRLAFAELFEPPSNMRSAGFSSRRPLQGNGRTRAQPHGAAWVRRCIHARRTCSVGGGAVPSPAQARTLREIAQTQGESFYRGALAGKIAGASRTQGVVMTGADLAEHQADWVEPIAQDYRGLSVHEIPPSTQGIAALMALGILAEFELGAEPVDSAESYHLQIEAMKLAIADVNRYVSDPRTMRITAAQLLDPDYLRGRAARIDRKRAQPFIHGAPAGRTPFT